MSDLLSDLLNGRLQPVPLGGTVNGVMDYGPPDNDRKYSDSEPESDTEQAEYVQKEFDSYFPDEDELDHLTDVEDGCEASVIGTEIMEMLHVPRVFDVYKFDTYYKKELPIDSFKPKILDMINTNSVVIIHGATGCGKTTQVPQFILDECKENKLPCNIVVTQPRRIAAINIAQRVCEERGWPIGSVCGYQVGLDKNVGEDVILTYMTTEVLLQKLISQKNLNKYTHIIIDEVHERSKSLDFLLLVVRKYHFNNSPSVKIVLMSATMEAEEFAYYFRNIPRNHFEQHIPAPILHVNKPSEFTTMVYYNEQFASPDIPYDVDEPWISPAQYELCSRLMHIFDSLDEGEMQNVENRIGSVLVFLPGFHEIEEMTKILKEQKTSPTDWDIIPLHSSLAGDHMVKAFQRAKPGVRKIILSTNIAESSVTVPDVKYVVDFCLTKNMVVNETTKFASLSLQWASHNNCMQRAGRVGRVASGRVYRLVPFDFYNNQMQESSIPELQRAPLENVILYMKLLDLNDTPKNVLALAISPPNLKDVEACVWSLKETGALLQTCRGRKTAHDGDLTFMGRVMGSLPIDIRLSKLILLGHMFSSLEETVIMAAGCMTRNLFVQNYHERFKSYKTKLFWSDYSRSDFLAFLGLYNVWLKKQREGSFRSTSDEYAWCKINYINLKGMREWGILINEINSRLKKFKIEKPQGVTGIKLAEEEKLIVLKILIAGAFYPNYFVRSSDFGQIDAKEAVRLLNGRDPFNTVYFTNMKVDQPGQIYVRQMKELLQPDETTTVKIGVDAQSSKLFVEYKRINKPESVTVGGRQYIATNFSKIGNDVYEAVRKRQLNIPFRLRVLPSHKAWDFANKMEEKNKQLKEEEELNCFSTIHYSPLPPLDIEYISVIITHIVDAGHFYCQNYNDETKMHLDNIYTALNQPGVFLEPTEAKIKVGHMYAAMFSQDSKYYRCKVLEITPGKPEVAHVQYIDYGNIEKVYVNRLCKIPDTPECKIDAIAMCCVLSGVQPHLILNPKGFWDERVNEIFRKKSGMLLNAKVYSVIDDVVHLELFNQKQGSVSFNEWLIDQGYGQKCEESQRSKMDHEVRQQVLASDDPTNMTCMMNQVTTARSYADFEAPSTSEATEIVELKGPYSPLEMKVCGLVQASLGASVRIDGDSVNAVLLDDSPEDPHSRLLVAATVSQSSVSNTIKLSQTTLMPLLPGLPMLLSLMFCPQMEPKLTPDGCRVASVLCGLGYKEYTQKSNFAMHDMSLILDTDLDERVITRINLIRHCMNRALKIMNNIYDELAYPDELYVFVKKLKDELFNLLHMKQQSVDRVNVKFADCWNKNSNEDVEILQMALQNDPDDIWPMLWFVKLKQDKDFKISINKNLDEMDRIAKRLEPEREIICELCNSVPLRTIHEVRIHLHKRDHLITLQEYQEGKR